MKRYLKEKEICDIFGISHNTARKHFGHAVIKIGKCIRYDISKIKEMSNEQT